MSRLVLFVLFTMFSMLGPWAANAAFAGSGVAGKISDYDSTVNFLGSEVIKYKGQVLYLPEKPGNDREFGFTGFFVRAESNDTNVYRPNDKYYTSYGAVAGKYFKVLDIVPHPDAAKGDIFFGSKCFLKLQERDSSAIVYYEYNFMNEFSFPFFDIGFVEKQKKMNMGNYFVYPDTVLKSLAEKTDPVTGKPVSFRTGDTWKCVDVVIPVSSHSLSLVVQNTLGEKTTIPQGCRNYTLVQELTYKKKYGIPTFNRLLRGDLYPGMTKEMVKLSVGEPYQVNGKLTHGTDRKKEEWLYYTGKTLMFDNDVLIEMKDTQPN